MTPEAPTKAGPQGSWFSRSQKQLVGLGCVLPLLCCVGSCLVSNVSDESDPMYRDALSRANANAEVQVALGRPVTPAFLPLRRAEMTEGRATPTFVRPVKGPRGKGTLVYNATREGNTWFFNELQVVVDGKTIELMDRTQAPRGGSDD